VNEAREGRHEPDLAERWMRDDSGDRRLVRTGLIAAVVLHVIVLFVKLPAVGREPVRVDAPRRQEMKVEFLRPPARPKVERIPAPPKRTIPRPDPTPLEPEPEVAAPPPPADPAPPIVQGPIRVAPGQGPGLIKRVEPIYPPIAQAARLEGVVVLDAVISRDGTVTEIRVLRQGNPMLTSAAVEALKQWRYAPGSQDVILTVTVNFTLR
jgi:protein TonB